jgi:hypothetical protein
MNGWRILVTGGMLLVLSGLIYMIGYVVFFLQPLEKTSVISLELALDTAVKGQLEIARGYAREFAALENRRLSHWLVIAHLVGAGLTALAAGSFIRALELKKRWETILSYLFLLGGVLSASGYIVQFLGYSFYGWGLSVLGYVWQLTGVTGFLIALVLYIVARPKL